MLVVLVMVLQAHAVFIGTIYSSLDTMSDGSGLPIASCVFQYSG